MRDYGMPLFTLLAVGTEFAGSPFWSPHADAVMLYWAVSGGALFYALAVWVGYRWWRDRRRRIVQAVIDRLEGKS
ncbi:hypothetical protein [Paraburkholderia unamae]|uniref:Uncharacterized protein n=1 Tax=Paraburkholderia unamae TaxID=219649 RepID=A0ACC6RGX1_9BURK